jgi:hypothetical protein
LKVHKALGPGLLESSYRACLAHELRRRGLRVQEEVPLPIEYEGIRIEVGYRLDLLVEGLVVTELKTVRRIVPIHEATAPLAPEAWKVPSWTPDQLSREAAAGWHPSIRELNASKKTHGPELPLDHPAVVVALSP